MYDFLLPDLGEGLIEAEIVTWHVAVGDQVDREQLLVEVETAKSLVEITSPVAGTVTALGAEVGSLLGVGLTLVSFQTPEESPAPAVPDDTPAAPAPPVVVAADQAGPPVDRSPTAVRLAASPATRTYARSMGVDLSTVTGTGPAGRITRADVDLAIESRRQPEPVAAEELPPPTQAASAATVPKASTPAPADETVPLRGLRRQIARAMTRSWTQIPHVTEFREVDATGLVAARSALRESAGDDEQWSRLTYLPFLILACARGLARFRQLNASLDPDRELVTYHRSVHIGVATAGADGLSVPVIRDAGNKSLGAISAELRSLSAKVRDRTAQPAELTGSTFTVTNFGTYGTWLGTPIINPPESGIAGFGRIRESVIAENGVPVVRPVLPIAVSADHRLVDGDVLAAFVDEIAAIVAEPIRLLKD